MVLDINHLCSIMTYFVRSMAHFCTLLTFAFETIVLHLICTRYVCRVFFVAIERTAMLKRMLNTSVQQLFMIYVLSISHECCNEIALRIYTLRGYWHSCRDILLSWLVECWNTQNLNERQSKPAYVLMPFPGIHHRHLGI